MRITCITGVFASFMLRTLARTSTPLCAPRSISPSPTRTPTERISSLSSKKKITLVIGVGSNLESLHLAASDSFGGRCPTSTPAQSRSLKRTLRNSIQVGPHFLSNILSSFSGTLDFFFWNHSCLIDPTVHGRNRNQRRGLMRIIVS